MKAALLAFLLSGDAAIARETGRDTDVITVPLDVRQHTIDVTLAGYMYGLRHALPLLIRQGGGVIVYTTSSEVWMGETGVVLTLKRYS